MRRSWLHATLIVLVLLAGAGAIVWHELTRVHAVSVSQAVDRFRAQHPAASVLDGPAPGVYALATHGSERISAGGVSHVYPKTTTLTVTPSGPCLQVRWDALAERWMQWHVCSSPEGWQLRGYTDVHKFLYLQDRHDYACPAAAIVFPVGPRPTSFTCTTSKGLMAVSLSSAGNEVVTVGGVGQPTSRVHAVMTATGASANEGTADLWVRTSDGLPVRATVTNHGHQVVVGSTVTYDEHASYLLTSTTPLR